VAISYEGPSRVSIDSQVRTHIVVSYHRQHLARGGVVGGLVESADDDLKENQELILQVIALA
jgi:hypothetical protein